MLAFFLALLIFLVTIFIVAGLHELGHYLFARLFGIKILCFSIGFGKALWRKKDKHGAEYVLAALPLGGYVKLLDTREGPVPAEQTPYAFDKRPIYQRFCVLAGGPLFNFILAVLAFWVIYLHGVTYIKPIVSSVIPHSIAARANIQPQDEILAINQRTTLSWAAVTMALMHDYGEPGRLNITVRAPAQEKPVIRTVNFHKADWHLNDLHPDLFKSFGIEPYMPASAAKKPLAWPANLLQTKHYTLASAFVKALAQTYYFTTFNAVILFKMLTGVISWQGIGGPISIFQVASGAAQHGFFTYLHFLAIISISIGFINLLPVPGLDGAQIVYLLYEFMRGKPLSLATQLLAFRLGLIILIILMVQSLINDLLRLK